MKPPLEQNYYELLEVPRDATVAELDRAYDRAKAFYGVGSIAVYSLTAPEELKQVQDRIDEAYLILSDESARAEYDARVGPPSPDERPLHREVREAREKEAAKEADAKARVKADAETRAKNEADAKAEEKPEPKSAEGQTTDEKAATDDRAEQPVDRVAVEDHAEAKPPPPSAEEKTPADAIPAAPPEARPRTPAPVLHAAAPEPAPAAAEVAEVALPTPATEVRLDLTVRAHDEKDRREARLDAGPHPPPLMEAPEPSPRGSAPAKRDSKPPERVAPKVAEIPADAVFSGEYLRKLRETQGLSVQELSDRTKIGKSHLENIEADRYGSLPPLVYLRGFLMSYARELKLDPVRVSKSYLEQHAKGGERAKG